MTRAYSVLVEDEEDHGCRELPESACREVPRNAARLVGGLTLQKLGDRIVDPKTVLAWLLTSLGAPAFLIGLLVPVRESGSLLPQAAMVPWVRRFGLRKRVWAVGGFGQAIAVVAIGLAAVFLDGAVAGWAILAALAVFSLSRALSSIASKDILGKTVPRGNRGSVTGLAASVAGFGAMAVGTGLSLFGESAGAQALGAMILAAAVLWIVASFVFLTIDETPSPGDAADPATSLRQSFDLLRSDLAFRNFVVARTLLLVTALSPPFVVSLAAESGRSAGGLGSFVVAAGIAGLVGSPVWGRLADRSSRLVMAGAAVSGGLAVFAYLAVRAVWDATVWLAPVTYLVLAVIHAGARMGRKTYVVDMARGDERTRYVAVSNTLIGIALLATGVVGAAASRFGEEWALAGLAVAGLAGALVSWRLPEIHAEES
jgi:hypothetical protein